MVLKGLGAKLPSAGYGAPKATLTAALERFEAVGLHVTARSRWYESEAVPKSAQPNFTNAVVRVETKLAPAAILALLHRIEKEFGRVRAARTAPPVINLDIIAYAPHATPTAPTPPLPPPRLPLR